jgi:hypothetical protein
LEVKTTRLQQSKASHAGATKKLKTAHTAMLAAETAKSTKLQALIATASQKAAAQGLDIGLSATDCAMVELDFVPGEESDSSFEDEGESESESESDDMCSAENSVERKSEPAFTAQSSGALQTNLKQTAGIKPVSGFMVKPLR